METIKTLRQKVEYINEKTEKTLISAHLSKDANGYHITIYKYNGKPSGDFEPFAHTFKTKREAGAFLRGVSQINTILYYNY